MQERMEELSEAARFFDLVQGITARLVGARGAEIDAAVQDGLARIGVYFGGDSVSLGAITTTGDLIPSIHMWSRLPPSGQVETVDPPPGPRAW